MAILKCKMCGGDLNVQEGITVAECEYCGTKQTLPNVNDENLRGLYNRANTLRIKCEFDKAEQLYEKILQVNSEQAEAYWGIILCRYGIEYVEDPQSFKRIPTCHRASFDSIVADEDYKLAVKYADASQRTIYESQAQEIDRIQKEIIAVSSKESPYDVFICYKETDENGKRTQDSVIANDIYYQLTQEGFKVFYAAITLEDKLGSAYEPCIFAALNSAKVMLAIGTKPEYFNSVWVKNEWSRYLKIMKKDRAKMLIPCFKDMDAYDLPEEFSHLQSQDMSKIGFINDVVRGIKKVIVKETEAPVATPAPVATSSATNVDALLKRVFIFLEDGDFDSADEYSEKVLDINPECAEAYIGKLMSELKARNKKSLAQQSEPFNGNKNFQKALRYATEQQKEEYEGYIDAIITANKEKAYQFAVSKMEDAETDGDYLEAANLFKKISGYKDSDELALECAENAKEVVYDFALSDMEKATTAKEFTDAAKMFDTIIGYKDAEALASECRTKAETINVQLDYERAVTIFGNPISLSQLQKAEDIFSGIKDYKDSAEYLAKMPERVEEFKKEEIYSYATYDCENSNSVVALRTSLQRLEEIGVYKDSANLKEKIKARIADLEKKQFEKEKAIKQQENIKVAQKVIKVAVIIAIIAVIIGIIAGSIYNKKVVVPRKKYEAALAEFNAGNYQAAYDAFVKLGDYEDAAAQAESARVAKNKVALKDCKVGDVVTLGMYEQDNNESKKEEIEWQVLEIRDNQALVISKYVLDGKSYSDNSHINATWETCTLRKWLNADFINTAFVDSEKDIIAITDVPAEEKPKHGDLTPNPTKDKVFLLSPEEVKQYFSPDNAAKKCWATEYAKEKGIYVQSTGGSKGVAWWWLRGSNNDYQNTSSYILFTGDIGCGYSIANVYGVRPAMWIDLSTIE